jgi:spermidine synthase
VFAYLRDSPARIDVERGDARLLLERELARGDKQKFDVLILDAFSGDAIPVHLLTQEAFETYWQHLDPDGIIAVHVTSRHVNLLPVLQGASAYFHADSALNINYALVSTSKTSVWVFLTRNPGALNIQGLKQTPPSFEEQITPHLWTDDYSDILRLIRYQVIR